MARRASKDVDRVAVAGAVGLKLSLSPSRTARRRSRFTADWPDMRRLRSPNTWSMAAATAAKHAPFSRLGAADESRRGIPRR